MPERLNTTEQSGESAVWSPATDEVIQIDGNGDRKAIVELHARLSEDLPFAYVTSASVARDAFISVAKLPFMKLVWHSNKAGDQIKAWSL